MKIISRLFGRYETPEKIFIEQDLKYGDASIIGTFIVYYSITIELLDKKFLQIKLPEPLKRMHRKSTELLERVLNNRNS